MVLGSIFTHGSGMQSQRGYRGKNPNLREGALAKQATDGGHSTGSPGATKRQMGNHFFSISTCETFFLIWLRTVSEIAARIHGRSTSIRTEPSIT